MSEFSRFLAQVRSDTHSCHAGNEANRAFLLIILTFHLRLLSSGEEKKLSEIHTPTFHFVFFWRANDLEDAEVGDGEMGAFVPSVDR